MTPFLIMTLTGFAIFMGVLGYAWARNGASK